MKILLLGRQSIAKAEDLVSAMQRLGYPTDFLLFPNFHYAEKNGVYRTSIGEQKAPRAKTRVGYYGAHFFSILLFLFRNFRKRTHDILFAIDWFEGAILLTYRFFFARDTKVIFYSYDGYFPKKVFSAHSVIGYVERWVARHADEVWNVNENIARERERQGVQTRRSKTVPLGIARKVSRWETQNSNHFLFVGNFKEGHNLLRMVDVFSDLANKGKDVKLTLVGKGNLYDKVLERIKERQAEKHVFLRGFVEEKTLLAEIESGRYCAGIALYEETPEIACADPGKIKEYLSWRVPVITTAHNAFSEEIKGRNLGYVIREEDFSERICSLRASDLLEQQENIDRYVQAHAFEDILKRELTL